MPRGSPSFADYFTPADFAAIADPLREGKNEEYRAASFTRVVPALAAFIDAMQSAGRLEPLAGTGGRSGRLMDAWNGLFDPGGDRENHLRTIAESLSHDLTLRPAMDLARGGIATSEEAYKAVVEAVDKGNLDDWNNVDDYCVISGDRLKIRMTYWRMRMIKYDAGRKNFVPIEDISPQLVVEGEVDWPTGELLIADWFRLQEFTDAVKDAEGGPSINSAAGCVEHTKACLERHGFVSVFVSNTSPLVFVEDGALVVGDTDQDQPDAPKSLGMITTDLWWTTIIDRQRLVEIVAGRIGQEAAETAVADYLEANDVTRVKVEPGTHHLYYAGAPEIFTGAFRSPDLNIDDRIKPMFVLSPRPLSQEEQPALAVSP